MAIFLNSLGVKNYKIATENHIWNAVYIDNNWYHLDLTWDDPVTKDSAVDTLSHKFFMINTNKNVLP